MFSDESRFKLSMNDGRLRIWRRPNERFRDEHIHEYDAFGRGSVMIWAGISLGGRTDIVFVDGTLTAQRYIDEILRPIVVPYAGAIGPNFILQDDNARPHRARITDDFLEEEAITRMDWPAVSPDLNPIEHLWDELGRKVTARLTPQSTEQQLRELLLEEWRRIPQRSIDKLINSMRTRCAECIAAQGGHTHY